LELLLTKVYRKKEKGEGMKKKGAMAREEKGETTKGRNNSNLP